MSDEASPLKSDRTRSSIWRMYRDAADHDYLLARFSARSNLLYQFWWNAQQATEKYLKAALLMNGFPVNSYGHELREMFEVATHFSGDLLPSLHCPPRYIRQNFWANPNPSGFFLTSSFVESIEANGSPDNRYRTFSTYTRSTDLRCFDELCFMLRRIAFPLELFLEEEGMTAGEVLQNHRERQLHPKMAFELGLEGRYADVWGEHFRWCNFAYFHEAAFLEGAVPKLGGAINAEPFLRLDSGHDEDLRTLQWIADNGLPKRLRKSIISEIEEKRNASSV